MEPCCDCGMYDGSELGRSPSRSDAPVLLALRELLLLLLTFGVARNAAYCAALLAAAALLLPYALLLPPLGFCIVHARTDVYTERTLVLTAAAAANTANTANTRTNTSS